MAATGGNILGDEESQLSFGSSNKIKVISFTQNLDDEKKKYTSLTIAERLGLPDFFALDVWRASVGELLGSAVLIFMLDTIVISTLQSDVKMPNLIMSILIAITLTILILAVFPVSGGHISPVITFSSALVGLISMSRAIIYIVAQCVGAILGALALKAVVSSTIEQRFSLGGCTITVITPGPNGPVNVGLDIAQAFWLEFLCTFALLFGSLWMAYDHRQSKALGLITVMSIVGLLAGLLVFISTTVTAKKGYAGAGMNPARCFGAAIVRGGPLWNGHWIFWVGPGLACFAFYFYTKIIPTNHFHAGGYKHDFLALIGAFFRSENYFKGLPDPRQPQKERHHSYQQMPSMQANDTVNHLFSHCPVTAAVWHFFFSLFSLSWVMPSSTIDAFESWILWRVDKFIKRIWRMIPAVSF